MAAAGRTPLDCKRAPLQHAQAHTNEQGVERATVAHAVALRQHYNPPARTQLMPSELSVCAKSSTRHMHSPHRHRSARVTAGRSQHIPASEKYNMHPHHTARTRRERSTEQKHGTQIRAHHYLSEWPAQKTNEIRSHVQYKKQGPHSIVALARTGVSPSPGHAARRRGRTRAAHPCCAAIQLID